MFHLGFGPAARGGHAPHPPTRGPGPHRGSVAAARGGLRPSLLRIARLVVGGGALLAALAWSGAALAGEPSLDQERARFAEADRLLNEVYAEAANELPGAVFDELRLDQRRWLERRDPYAESVARIEAGPGGLGDPEADPWYWIARTERSEARTAVLGGWLAHFREPPTGSGWAGAWIDGYGGLLLVDDAGPERLVFSLTVVRGPTFHTGEIDGVAERIGRSARFTTVVDHTDGPTWLTLVLEGPRLRLWAENAHGFHGMRAYFDGDYVRVRGLAGEERERLAALLGDYGR